MFRMSAVRGRRLARRRVRGLLAITLWLWSSWVIAAGCCCEPDQSVAATVAPLPHPANSADEHDHDHGHAGPDGIHSQHDLPLDGCIEIKAPIHGIVPKEAAPPLPSLALDHLAHAPAQAASLLDLSGDARHDWSLPPPPILPEDPFLETIRLLL